MNREIKKRWIDALRSGEYKQGHYRLRLDNQFCCLGVLCDLMDSHHWYDSPTQGYSYGHFGSTHFLPLDVMKWAELDSEDPRVIHHDKTTKLSDLNDNGIPFEEHRRCNRTLPVTHRQHKLYGVHACLAQPFKYSIARQKVCTGCYDDKETA